MRISTLCICIKLCAGLACLIVSIKATAQQPASLVGPCPAIEAEIDVESRVYSYSEGADRAWNALKNAMTLRSEQKVFFVVIYGGRSSGKSALIADLKYHLEDNQVRVFRVESGSPDESVWQTIASMREMTARRVVLMQIELDDPNIGSRRALLPNVKVPELFGRGIDVEIGIFGRHHVPMDADAYPIVVDNEFAEPKI